jgi:hypothetical protein
MVNKIIFSASVASVKTMVDGGIRITLDLPEQAIAQAAALMECRREMIPLRVEIMADTNEAENDN